MSDALDRAAQAAHAALVGPNPDRTWDDLPEYVRSGYRGQIAAALGVLIADIREVLHADRPAAMRVVQAVVILDRYTQSGTDNGSTDA